MKILIYRIGSLGDTVVALPCFHLIANKYPNAKRYVLTNFPVTSKAAPLESILGESGLVHGYIQYPLYTRSLKKILKLRDVIQKLSPDMLIYLTPARGLLTALRDLFFFKFCGIPKIIGVPLTKSLQKNQYDQSIDGYEPEAKRLSRCISMLGDTKPNDIKSWNLLLSQKEKNHAEAAMANWSGGKNYITCCAGTKMSSKDWGIENWSNLLELLSQNTNETGIIFIGSADESKRCDLLKKKWNGHSLNLCGKLSPRESSVIIKRSLFFIGHDSGPMHLASAVNTPCIAIFSARNIPAIWFPFDYKKKHRVIYHKVDCYGCYLENCIEQQKKCILSITVKEVLSAIDSLRKQFNIEL